MVGKGLTGLGTAGVVWSAPRVVGLTIRPEFAGAQSASVPTTTSPGLSLDVTTPVSVQRDGTADAIIRWRETAVTGLAPGVDLARVYQWDSASASGGGGQIFAELRGPAVGFNCDLAGVDVDAAGHDADLATAPDQASTSGQQFERRYRSNSTSDPSSDPGRRGSGSSTG